MPIPYLTVNHQPRLPHVPSTILSAHVSKSLDIATMYIHEVTVCHAGESKRNAPAQR